MARKSRQSTSRGNLSNTNLRDAEQIPLETLSPRRDVLEDSPPARTRAVLRSPGNFTENYWAPIIKLLTDLTLYAPVNLNLLRIARPGWTSWRLDNREDINHFKEMLDLFVYFFCAPNKYMVYMFCISFIVGFISPVLASVLKDLVVIFFALTLISFGAVTYFTLILVSEYVIDVTRRVHMGRLGDIRRDDMTPSLSEESLYLGGSERDDTTIFLGDSNLNLPSTSRTRGYVTEDTRSTACESEISMDGISDISQSDIVQCDTDFLASSVESVPLLEVEAGLDAGTNAERAKDATLREQHSNERHKQNLESTPSTVGHKTSNVAVSENHPEFLEAIARRSNVLMKPSRPESFLAKEQRHEYETKITNYYLAFMIFLFAPVSIVIYCMTLYWSPYSVPFSTLLAYAWLFFLSYLIGLKIRDRYEKKLAKELLRHQLPQPEPPTPSHQVNS